MAVKSRNKYGQAVSTKSNVEIKVTKQLQDIVKAMEIRVKPLIRDELVKTLREEIYASYTPATKNGNESTETKKKSKTFRPYHHTGTLVSKIHGWIEGDVVKAGPIEGATYDDGTPVTDVYNYLKFGTSDTPHKISVKTGKTVKGFHYDNGNEFSHYISQEPHNFEARTRERMRTYINDLPKNLSSTAWREANGLQRYIDKVARKNR